jgi:hypothetical protein
MTTTIDIPDDLARRIRTLADARQTTLRALVIEGLRWVLAQRKEKKPFRLRDASVGGRGLQPGVKEGDWDRICDLIYERRDS